METEIRTTEIKTKVCRKCGLEKEIDRFGKNKTKKDGLNSYCKDCHNSYISIRNKAKKIKIPKKRECTQAAKITKLPVNPVREHKDYPPRVTPRMDEKSKTRALTFYQKCFLNGYETLLSYGLSQSAIQNIFGVSQSGLDVNGLRTKEGEEAYQRGMAELQAMMCHQMVIRAMGYDYNEERITYDRAINKLGKPVWRKVRKEVWKKHQPSNAEVLIFFMTNRFPDKWKVSRELLTGKTEGYDDSPSQRNRKIIESQAAGVLAECSGRPEAQLPVQDGAAQLSGGCVETGPE